ncbi:MAG TPA: DUF4255 domain-containing protein [Vicinamibacterales bacterium]
MYTVLAATSDTLRQMLAGAMAADVGPSGLATFFTGGNLVSLATPEEMRTAGQQGLSVWLYRVARDEYRLNDPPIVRTTPAGAVDIMPPPLPVRLHYLLTPIANGNPDTEQRILGRALQLFHTHPIVSGGFLKAELAGTPAELHVHLEALGIEEITRVWEALEGSYQLCVSYEVTLLHIHSGSDPLRASLVESVHPDAALIVDREFA